MPYWDNAGDEWGYTGRNLNDDDSWDDRPPDYGTYRPVPPRQPSGYAYRSQQPGGRPTMPSRWTSQYQPPSHFGRGPNPAPHTQLPRQARATDWDTRNTHPGYTSPSWGRSAPPPSTLPRRASRATSRAHSFAEPAKTRSNEVWTLARGQPTATFEVVMEFARDTRKLLIAKNPQLLQKRQGPKYCLGSVDNAAKVKRYVLGQMRKITELHKGGDCSFYPGDRVRIQFIPIGYDMCQSGDSSSCERSCARHLLAADQLIACYEEIVRLPQPI